MNKVELKWIGCAVCLLVFNRAQTCLKNSWHFLLGQYTLWVYYSGLWLPDTVMKKKQWLYSAAQVTAGNYARVSPYVPDAWWGRVTSQAVPMSVGANRKSAIFRPRTLTKSYRRDRIVLLALFFCCITRSGCHLDCWMRVKGYRWDCGLDLKQLYYNMQFWATVTCWQRETLRSTLWFRLRWTRRQTKTLLQKLRSKWLISTPRSWHLPLEGGCWRVQASHFKWTPPRWQINLVLDSKGQCPLITLIFRQTVTEMAAWRILMGILTFWIWIYMVFLFSWSSGQTPLSPCCTHNYHIAQFDSWIW